jgi:hypothetical protein
MANEIFSPVILPCSGRTMPNKLIKVRAVFHFFVRSIATLRTQVALYEHLSKFHGGPPNEYHMGLYTEWAKHDWGMIVTGNVQVSQDHLTLGRDIVTPTLINEETLAQFKKLARTIHAEDSRQPSARPLAVMQLSHVGRQSPNFIGGRNTFVPPLAPSSVRVGSNKRVQSNDGTTYLEAQNAPHLSIRALFQVPREMTLDDIKDVQQAFIRGALTALKAGFDGVQLHCAHGCKQCSVFWDTPLNRRFRPPRSIPQSQGISPYFVCTSNITLSLMPTRATFGWTSTQQRMGFAWSARLSMAFAM